MLELLGGEGGTSELAFRRGLSSGGSLDKKTNANLDDPHTQRVLLHYLAARYACAVIIQPYCRSTGPRSHMNAAIKYTTWKQHREEELPRITFRGVVATVQDDREILPTRAARTDLDSSDTTMGRADTEAPHLHCYHGPMQDRTHRRLR